MEGYETTTGGYEPRQVPEPAMTGRMEPLPAILPAEEPAALPTGRAALAGVLMALIGAWGGAVAYFGPEIGLGPAGARSWQWSTAHTVLNLAPGAAALLGGLMLLVGSRLLRGGVQRVGAVLAFGAAGWFVLGPAVYPVFYGGPTPGYGQTGHGPLMNLASLAGYGAGVGVALCLLSGLAMAWSLPRIVWARRSVPEGMRRQTVGAALPMRNTEPAGI